MGYSNLELDLWGMLGEALALAKPTNEVERAKLDELSYRYGCICDEMEAQEQGDLDLLEEVYEAA